jgi:hypothetical protein
MHMFTPVRLTTLAALLAAVGTTRADEAVPPRYDQAVRAEAPNILGMLKAKGYKNVGVLKFLVRNEGGKLRDDFGPINRTLADRLEIALLLALKKEDGIGILFRASDVVAKTGNARATHRTQEGRAEFFEFNPSPFAFPWNPKQTVQPDAFLTGEATLSPDLTRLTVRVQVFAGDGPDKLKLQDVCRFSALADPRTLIDAGVSFVGARGPVDELLDPSKQAGQNSKDAPRPDDTAEVWNRRAEYVLSEMKRLPVQIEVLYNGEVEKVEANPFRPPAERDNVLLRVREPLSREAVSFRLTNRGDETYAVVIKVNGQSTIYKEEQEPLECYKWVLEPGKSTIVPGFLMRNDKKAEEFAVRSETESQRDEVKYGYNAGTYSFTVFRPAKSKVDETLVKMEKERDLSTAMIARGTEQLTHRIAPSNLDSFRGELAKLTKKEEETAGSRGIIVPGKEIDKAVTNVSFTALPIPAFSATIRYFDPKGK